MKLIDLLQKNVEMNIRKYKGMMMHYILFILMMVMVFIGNGLILHSSTFLQFFIGVVISLFGVIGMVACLCETEGK